MRAAKRNPKHEMYETSDADAPAAVKDSNGEVVLGMCRRCGKAEIELSEPCTPTVSPAMNPWRPMSRPIDLKLLGKLAEELSEAGAAVARCLIQGIGECEPVTRKPNKQWLEDEMADVVASAGLVCTHFRLNRVRMRERIARKRRGLKQWHAMD